MSFVFPNIEISGLVRGADFTQRASVVVASTQNSNWTTSASAAFVDPTLTLSALTAGAFLGQLDSVELSSGNRVLLKDMAAISAGTAGDDGMNGLWVITGGTSTTLTLERDDDMIVGDSALGLATIVQKGTVEAGTTWVCTTDLAVASDNTNDLTFVRYSLPTSGTGLEVSRGGTGATTHTTNAILKGAGTSAIVSSGVLIDVSDNVSGVGTFGLSGDIFDVNGNELIYLTATASAITAIEITNQITGTPPQISANSGGGAAVGLDLLDSAGNNLLKLITSAIAVNWIEITNRASGLPPLIGSEGEANTGLSIIDSNQNNILKLNSTASAVNWVEVTNSATGVAPILGVEGENSIGLNITDSNSVSMLVLNPNFSATNWIEITNSSTGTKPVISTDGEADIGIEFHAQGNEQMLILAAVASAVNELTISSAATATNPSISSTGSDTNIGLDITTKGTGVVTIAAGSATTSGELRLADNTGGQYGAWAAPATVTSAFTLNMPDGVGTSGQVLSTDGSNPAALSWISSSSNRDFILVPNEITVKKTTDTTIAYFGWDDSEYGSATAGVLIVYGSGGSTQALTVTLIEDPDGAPTTIATVTVTAATTGIFTGAITIPSADNLLAVAVKKAASGGTSGTLKGVQIRIS